MTTHSQLPWKKGTSLIEPIIFVILLSFLIQSCNDKTSVSFLAGQEFKKMKVEFEKGYSQALQSAEKE